MKVNRILLACAIFLMTATVISSCKKNAENQSSANPPDRANKSSLVVNNTNPFNYLGQLHNDALDVVGSDPNFSRLRDPDVHAIIQDYINATLSLRLNEPYDSVISSAVEYANYGLDVTLNLPADLEAVGTISSDVKSNLLALYDAVGISKPMNQINTLNDLKTPADAVTAVQALEADIITRYGNPTSTTIDRTIDLRTNDGKATYLLIACAIAKYSYHYWHEVLNNSSSSWYVVFADSTSNKGTSFLTKAWQWCERTGADIGGFLGAGSAGASAGSTDGKKEVKGTYTVKISEGVKAGKEASAKVRAEQEK